MGQTAADREALMKALKVELKNQIWAEPRARPTFGRCLSLFITNPEPMWVYDVQTLRILDVNEAIGVPVGLTDGSSDVASDQHRRPSPGEPC